MAFGSPMVVNSCCRSRAYNIKVGGNPRSLHMMDNPVHPIDGTAAVDISATGGGVIRLALVKAALDLGWSVGIAKTFTHLDRRDLAGLTPAMFTY